MFDALRCWIAWLANMIYYYIVESAAFILTMLAGVANLLLGLLPTFAIGRPQLDGPVVGLLNYIVPVGSIVTAFGVLMACWILYRLYQWALKWAKAAD